MEIIFSNNSKKQLSKLDARIQQKVLFTLEKFKNNQPVDIIKLKGKSEEFRIRTGNYRIQLQKIKEGDKERLSAFEGLIIATKHGSGISGTFTVRKIVDGIGVERVFPLHAPMIEKIELVRRAKARRAKLYYIREKAAREVRRKMRSIIHEGDKLSAVADATEDAPSA